ncbi:hypothetical protein QJS04_geneDACA021418 [Acorus gramineus]|uniref:RNase H type-1 domain-containing protein n=1 Tax=Acorus gramineus TaxID=55184 RepID=A0AAV9A6V8_ACOGR|nr:hypothetical protein QJS04_geneDACA021418 [Acorus gramineus]
MAFSDLRTFSTLSASLAEGKATHVYREGNQVADHLVAFQSLFDEESNFWPDLLKILKDDKEGKDTIRFLSNTIITNRTKKSSLNEW